MILVWMIGILLLAGLICWPADKWRPDAPKWIALSAILINSFLAILILLQHQRVTATGLNTWLVDFNTTWIAAYGISFHLAADGLAVVMLLLTCFLGLLAVLCSWNEIKNKIGFYYANLLWTLAGITGVFVAMDLFLFYCFWEVMLVPMFFLIFIWGDTNRRYAAYKFFIFTQAGGLLMLISILSLYFINGQQRGEFSFDYFKLLNTDLDASTAKWIMGGFLLAFLIKLPVVPLHNWLPDAHSEAPTAGSLILAGLLLKTGAYGMLRFVLPLFQQAAEAIAWWAMLLGVIGIIYGALLAYAQTDIKRLIAYTSVSHMGFVLLGIFSFKELALQGVVMQMVTHGISTGALFLLAGMLKERLHTRDIRQMGGLWTIMPKMGGFALLFLMASLGLPVLGNFIAEFLILMGAFSASATLTILATLGLVFSALYSLRLMQAVFLGPVDAAQPVHDLKHREAFMMVLLTASIIWLGLYPQPVFDLVDHIIQQLVKNVKVAAVIY